VTYDMCAVCDVRMCMRVRWVLTPAPTQVLNRVCIITRLKVLPVFLRHRHQQRSHPVIFAPPPNENQPLDVLMIF
jgi:hypothetical protein